MAEKLHILPTIKIVAISLTVIGLLVAHFTYYLFPFTTNAILFIIIFPIAFSLLLRFFGVGVVSIIAIGVVAIVPYRIYLGTSIEEDPKGLAWSFIIFTCISQIGILIGFNMLIYYKSYLRKIFGV